MSNTTNDHGKIRGIKSGTPKYGQYSGVPDPPTVRSTARRLNMSLSQKRGANQAKRSSIGFGCQTTRQRHYIKIAEWSLKQSNVKAVLNDCRLSKEAKATYAYIAWHCHTNKVRSFSEDAIASKHQEIGKLMDALFMVGGSHE